MIDPRKSPAGNDPPEHHADFLEFCALRSPEREASVQGYATGLRIGSASEVQADGDDGAAGRAGYDDEDDETESFADSTFDELDERRRNFGEFADSYPFDVGRDVVRLRKGGDASLYTFLALLSWFGKDAGPKGSDGARLFERVSAKAAEAYLGGPNPRVRSLVFGASTRGRRKPFAALLDDLCAQFGEGRAHSAARRKRVGRQKDAKLDVVAWVEFADRRGAKLIAFGQCATGKYWEEDSKHRELQPADWCRAWLAEGPAVTPVRSFFVPHRIERDDWDLTGIYGGVLYDRCRIASLAGAVGGPLKAEWAAWSAHVLRRVRRARK